MLKIYCVFATIAKFYRPYILNLQVILRRSVRGTNATNSDDDPDQPVNTHAGYYMHSKQNKLCLNCFKSFLISEWKIRWRFPYFVRSVYCHWYTCKCPTFTLSSITLVSRHGYVSQVSPWWLLSVTQHLAYANYVRK